MDEQDKQKIKRVLILVGALCGLLVIAGINRLANTSFFRAPAIDIFRTCDILSALVFAPIAVVILWLLFKVYDGYKSVGTTVIFITGVYFLGAGFGMHESFNVFISAYKQQVNAPILKSACFFDDKLGHWLFFAGFMLLSIAGAKAEIKAPYKEKLPLKFIIPAFAFGITTAAVIFMNMAWEKTITDILILIATVITVLLMQYCHSGISLLRLPVTLVLYTAYGGGALATLVFWLFR